MAAWPLAGYSCQNHTKTGKTGKTHCFLMIPSFKNWKDWQNSWYCNDFAFQELERLAKLNGFYSFLLISFFQKQRLQACHKTSLYQQVQGTRQGLPQEPKGMPQGVFVPAGSRPAQSFSCSKCFQDFDDYSQPGVTQPWACWYEHVLWYRSPSWPFLV